MAILTRLYKVHSHDYERDRTTVSVIHTPFRFDTRDPGDYMVLSQIIGARCQSGTVRVAHCELCGLKLFGIRIL